MYRVILINGVDDTRKTLYENNNYISCHNFLYDFAKKNDMIINCDEMDTFAEKIIKITANCIYYSYVIIDKKPLNGTEITG